MRTLGLALLMIPGTAMADVANGCGCGGGGIDYTDSDGDGEADFLDCAPKDPAIHSGATEVADNHKDDDCDGKTDESADSDGSLELVGSRGSAFLDRGGTSLRGGSVTASTAQPSRRASRTVGCIGPPGGWIYQATRLRR